MYHNLLNLSPSFTSELILGCWLLCLFVFCHKHIWKQRSLGIRICPLLQEFLGIDSHKTVGSDDWDTLESLGDCGDFDFESWPIPVACQGPWSQQKLRSREPPGASDDD